MDRKTAAPLGQIFEPPAKKNELAAVAEKEESVDSISDRSVTSQSLSQSKTVSRGFGSKGSKLTSKSKGFQSPTQGMEIN